MKLTIKQALQKGIEAHKEGKFRDAEHFYHAILQLQPTHPDANHNLGVLLLSINKIGMALPFLKTAFQSNPKIDQFWLSYIGALIKSNQPEKAKELLNEAKNQGIAKKKLNALEMQLNSLGLIEHDNSEPDQDQLNRLKDFYQAGRYLNAEKQAMSITKQFPNYQPGWKFLGAIFRKIGRNHEALDANQIAVKLSPQDPYAYNNLGNVLKELGRFEEAEKNYLQAIALKADFSETYSNLGNTLYELGRLEEALETTTQAIVLKPKYAQAYNNLGMILSELGRFEEAEKNYLQAVTLNPNFIEAHNNLGILLIGMGKIESALKHFKIKLELERGAKPINILHKSFLNISKAKIDHDIEQFEYLAASGYGDKKFHKLASIYRKISLEINSSLDTDIVPLSDKHQKLLGDTYNRAIHILDAPLLDKSPISKSLNVNKITDDYFNHDFGLTYIDEFLNPHALESLREFLLGSTIWFDFFHAGGYLGAYLEDGLASPLIIQIAEDLRGKLPKIFKDHKLTQLWAYKYDSRARDKDSFTGINAHADFAAINVNFWITPKSANLDKSSGGLVVYNSEAPLDWDFRTFNTNEQRIHEEILNHGGKKTIIPYNENRAVIFNSNLFHETDIIDFKDGYENRRINVTMLFGRRED